MREGKLIANQAIFTANASSRPSDREGGVFGKFNKLECRKLTQNMRGDVNPGTLVKTLLRVHVTRVLLVDFVSPIPSST